MTQKYPDRDEWAKPTLEDISEYVDLARGGAARRVQWDALVASIDHLTNDFPCIIQPISTEAKLVRGRIIGHSEQVNDTSKLGPPPEDKCSSSGRCNWIHQPNAYLGVGVELSLSEINARIGDRVGLIYVQPTRDMFLLRIGAIDLYRRTSGMCDLHEDTKNIIAGLPKDREGIKVHLLDAFIADFFSRKGSQDVYKITSAIGRAFFDAFPKLDGIMYDSVNHVRGACIAMRTESYASMRPTEAQIINVTADLGYGIYDFEEEAFSDSFDGITINWRQRT